MREREREIAREVERENERGGTWKFKEKKTINKKTIVMAKKKRL